MIVFAGCSYTWGSGLQYEYLLDRGWSVDKINQHLPMNSHLEHLSYEADEYRKQNNWPNLVSKELDKSFVIGTFTNGGSNISTILPSLDLVRRIRRTNSISTIVVQFTDWIRDINDVKIEEYPNNKLDIVSQNYIDTKILFQINQVVSKCNEIQSGSDLNYNHIDRGSYPKWVGLSWRRDVAILLKKHYPKNFIPIYYNDKEYLSFDRIDKGLRLCDSIPGVEDQHLNSEGCKVIANSIVKKLKPSGLIVK